MLNCCYYHARCCDSNNMFWKLSILGKPKHCIKINPTYIRRCTLFGINSMIKYSYLPAHSSDVVYVWHIRRPYVKMWIYEGLMCSLKTYLYRGTDTRWKCLNSTCERQLPLAQFSNFRKLPNFYVLGPNQWEPFAVETVDLLTRCLFYRTSIIRIS